MRDVTDSLRLTVGLYFRCILGVFICLMKTGTKTFLAWQSVTMLHEKNATCILGVEKQKCQPHTERYTPSNLHPLWARVSEESENSLFHGEGKQPPYRPPYLSVPTTGRREGLSYKSYHSARGGRARWEEDKGGGRRWEPLLCKATVPLSHTHVWSSVSPGCSIRREREREIERGWSYLRKVRERERWNRRNVKN